MENIFIIIMWIILIAILFLLKTGLIDHIFIHKEPEIIKLKCQLRSLLKNRNIEIKEESFDSGLRYIKVYYKDILFAMVEGYAYSRFRDNKTDILKLNNFLEEKIMVTKSAKNVFYDITECLEKMQKNEIENDKSNQIELKEFFY